MNPLAGLTMYDALAMLVSGFMWSLLLFPCPQNDICSSVFFGVLCYIIGLVYHRSLDYFCDIRCKKELKKSHKKCFTLRKKCAIWKEKCCLRNNRYAIRKAYKKVRAENLGKLNVVPSKVNYYAAYYRLMKNNCLNNIPVLEAQVAFCRNIIPILLVYCIKDFLPEGICQMRQQWFGCCGVYVFWGVAIVMLILVWCFTQKKIYELVWEGYFFIKEEK